jgi:hypothetical protein
MKYITFSSGMKLLALIIAFNLSSSCFAQLHNYFAGTNAGSGNTGTANTAVGAQSMDAGNTGAYNAAFGRSTLTNNTSGTDNTAIGGQALFFNTTGWSNTALGRLSLYNNTTGTQNTAVGHLSLFNNTTGTNNIAMGMYALTNNATGSENIALGFSALAPGSSGCVAIGHNAMLNGGAQYNVAIGYGAMSLAYTGAFNVAIGGNALKNNTATGNIGLGYLAGSNNTSGFNNVFLGYLCGINTTTGSQNIAIGTSTLGQNILGESNVIIGAQAGSNITSSFNVAIGDWAGITTTTGAYNTLLGSRTTTTTPTITEGIAIGYLATSNANNKTVIGRNVAGTVIGGYAAWSNLSDGRFKESIQNDVPGLAFINALEPVTYVISLEKLDKHLTQMMPDSVAKMYYKSEEEYAYNRTIRHTGFIAQEVEKAAQELGYAFDGVNKPTNPTDNYSLSYSTFVVPLVQAVKELDQKQTEKDKRIAQLESELEEMKTMLTQMQESMQILHENKVALAAQESFFSLSPNPSDDFVIVKINAASSNQHYTIQIADMNGNVIKSLITSPDNTEIEISTVGWAKGSYLVHVADESKSIGARILVVE